MPGPESIGGESIYPTQFQTTHWSVVLQAGQDGSSQSTEALEKLCRTYWLPVYGFARRKGCGEEDAKDLTQQFFLSLLQRNEFVRLDPRRGKFRTFLLTAFTHFLANDFDRANTLKRGGGKTIVPFDELSDGQLNQFVIAGGQSPENAFDRHWAQTILEQALAKLKAEMAEAGKAVQFELLKPFLTKEAGPGDYLGAAHELSVAESSVAVLVHRLRQAYRRQVRAEVAQTVSSPTELEDEMGHLFRVLNQ